MKEKTNIFLIVASVVAALGDIEFFFDPPQTYLALKPNMFALFFPGDAHAPMISDGAVHKCVVKVRVG